MDTVVLKVSFSFVIIFVLLHFLLTFLKFVWFRKIELMLFLGCLGLEIFISWFYGWKVIVLSSITFSLGAYAYIFLIRMLGQSVCVKLLNLLDSSPGQTLDEISKNL